MKVMLIVVYDNSNMIFTAKHFREITWVQLLAYQFRHTWCACLVAVHVKPGGISRIWLGGLIPDEFYAFRLAIWCDLARHSALSPVIYAQTESWPQGTDATNAKQFHGSLTSEQVDMPISEADGKSEISP